VNSSLVGSRTVCADALAAGSRNTKPRTTNGIDRRRPHTRTISKVLSRLERSMPGSVRRLVCRKRAACRERAQLTGQARVAATDRSRSPLV